MGDNQLNGNDQVQIKKRRRKRTNPDSLVHGNKHGNGTNHNKASDEDDDSIMREYDLMRRWDEEEE